MKDTEIIKALECCDGTLAGCKECPNYKNRFCCEIEGEALDLINRQKAEIEGQDSEIARLKGILDCYARQYGTVRCYTEGKDED